jgi:hypothetical protein
MSQLKRRRFSDHSFSANASTSPVTRSILPMMPAVDVDKWWRRQTRYGWQGGTPWPDHRQIAKRFFKQCSFKIGLLGRSSSER